MLKTTDYLQYLLEAEGMEKLPKGWTQKSLAKFSKSLTGKKATQKGFFDKCVERMRGKLDNPEGFCASVKDERHGSTFWRGKGKTPQQAGKDVKRIRNVRQEGFPKVRSLLRYVENPETKQALRNSIVVDRDKAHKKVKKVHETVRKNLNENEMYLGALMGDFREYAKEWQGPNIPFGDDSNRPNLIRKCTMLEDIQLKINCLRKLREQAAMNPFYQARIDRYIDEITDTYEPTEKPGTIPGNEFKTSGVGEDKPVEPINENLNEGMLGCAAAKYGYKQNKAIIDNAHAALKNCHKAPNPEKCKLLNMGRIRVSMKPFRRSVNAVRKSCKNAKEILG